MRFILQRLLNTSCVSMRLSVRSMASQVTSGSSRILYLNASHSDKSLVALGAQTFLSHLPGPLAVTELRLFDKGDNLPEYSLDEAQAKMNIFQGRATSQDRDRFEPIVTAAELLNNVDLVLISTPMWNWSVPYVLKKYIDTVVQPGVNLTDFTTPLPHLTGRKLVVFSSAGGFYDQQSVLQDFLNPFLKQVFGLMGFDNQHQVFIQGTAMRDNQELLDWTLSEAAKVSNKVQKTDSSL